MEKDSNASHVERSDSAAVVLPPQIVSDADLLKAGADSIKEDAVANVHLVSFPFPPP